MQSHTSIIHEQLQLEISKERSPDSHERLLRAGAVRAADGRHKLQRRDARFEAEAADLRSCAELHTFGCEEGERRTLVSTCRLFEQMH